ncbi:probable E3 ubiquitin-protein ligase ZFP1 [Trifolium pratense]|uniref:probable E3 ubiquitin-protein ligase ZFP1 n=1 Tax=Trifolium pratense TaxID=57577 RepID=UPI001E6981D8|nr:probable E3 ubiquitin-protein ligase ZFP1 [Trifolium pratense]
MVEVHPEEFPEMANLVQGAGQDVLVDPHRELRLDIEGMSYEDLLALGERIGNVNTGASEEIITSQLKTKLYTPNFLSIDLNELPPEDHESDTCIICQDEFKYRDNIGTIQCGHEFHADCISEWLMLKNECPICKSEAITKKD